MTKKTQKYKITDSSGNTIETFRGKETAKIWLPKLKKDYFDRELKIEAI